MAGFIPITIDPGRDLLAGLSVGLQLGRAMRRGRNERREQGAEDAVGRSVAEAYQLHRAMRDGQAEATPENMQKVNEMIGLAIGAAPAANMNVRQFTEIIEPLDEMITERMSNLTSIALASPAGSPQRQQAVASMATLMTGSLPADVREEDGQTVVIPEDAETEEDVIVFDDQTLQDVAEFTTEEDGQPAQGGMITYQKQIRQANERYREGDLSLLESGATLGNTGAETVLRERGRAADRETQQAGFLQTEGRQQAALQEATAAREQRGATNERGLDLRERELNMREAGTYSPRAGASAGGSQLPIEFLEAVRSQDLNTQYPNIAREAQNRGMGTDQFLTHTGQMLIDGRLEAPPGVDLRNPGTLFAAMDRQLSGSATNGRAR